MTETMRRMWALRLRELLDEGVPRKMAFLQVKSEIKAKSPGMPASRTQIYAWCRKFGVSTR